MTLRIVLIAVAAAACLSTTAFAAPPPPLVLTPTFVEDNDAVIAFASKEAPACTVHITELSDQRHDTTIVGVVGNRSVQSPQDTQAWMRAILDGLSKRGVEPQFDLSDSDVAPQPSPAARFGMQMVWLTPVAINFSANVVLTIDASGADGHILHQTYRGRTSKMNWANGTTEMQKAINLAFTDALNKMAPDLRALCQK